MMKNGQVKTNLIPCSSYKRSFDYFFLLTLDESFLDGSKNYDEIIHGVPKVNSIFPSEGNKDLFNQRDVIRKIFPEKAAYIKDLTPEAMEEGISLPFFRDYIVNETKPPKEYFHCFSMKYQPEEICYTWHFGVLIFFEEIQVKIKTDQKERGKSFFHAKALVIAAQNAFYILFKRILQEVYSRSRDTMEQPYELLIANFYTKLVLKRNTKNQFIINDFIYFIQDDSVIPYFDLNIFAFFSKFKLNDFLIIAEQFLKRGPIMVFSTDLSIIYPFFFSFINLVYPLHITNINDYFIMLSSGLISRVLYMNFATFIGVYSELPNDNVLKIIAESKGSHLLVINLDSGEIKRVINTSMDNNSLSNWEVNIINIDPKISYNNEESKHNYSNVIAKIFDFHILDEINLLDLIQNTIQETSATDYKNYKDSYFKHIPLGEKAYTCLCKIRNEFFSLFSKLLMFTLIYTRTEITNAEHSEDKEAPKNGILINFTENFETDNDLREFYSDFITTPSFNIIYKHKCKANDPDINNLILLDELLKVMIKDNKRLYFDTCLGIVDKISDKDEIHIVEINEEKNFLKIGDLHDALHIYNLILLRETKCKVELNKDIKAPHFPGYSLDEVAADKYLIKYSHINFFFEKFQYFFEKEKDLKLVSNLNLNLNMNKIRNNNFNDENSIGHIIFSEIEAFVFLIKTGTLYIGNLKHTTIASLIFILVIQILSSDSAEEKKSKFLFVLDLYKKTNGIGNNFNFISSLIYKVIFENKELRDTYEFEFLNTFKIFAKIPTFFIYICANHENKEKIDNSKSQDLNRNTYDNYITRLSLNQSFTEIEILVPTSQYLKCINQCVNYQLNVFPQEIFNKSINLRSSVNLLDSHIDLDNQTSKTIITSSNMSSVKCSKCLEENFLQLISKYENIGDLEMIIKHPMKILLTLLEEVLFKRTIVYSRKEMIDLVDPIAREEIRGLLFYCDFFEILKDYRILLSK